MRFKALAGMTAFTRQAPPANTGRAAITKAQADRWMREQSNWGRWGKDDQLGALNLVTPQKRQQAIRRPTASRWRVVL